MPEYKDSDDLRQRIIEESKNYLRLPIREGEWTTEQYMEWNGIDNNTAYRALKAMEADRKIYKRKGTVNGASVNIYGLMKEN